MALYTLEHLSFTYPNRPAPALRDVSLCMEQGEFITLCGASGCGKTTLLRLLKSVLTPHGIRSGEILFLDKPLETYDQRVQSERIGFVLQSPDQQLVTDKVWHELAFGLESLGMDTQEIRGRVAEMASFFGIQTWFHKNVTELSGGQKQLLNLASIMAMQPTVLILDEPTSQLDPIAAGDFLATLGKINRELGITILLTEHRLEEALPLSSRVLVLEEGKLIADGTPPEVGTILKDMGHAMFSAMPTPMRVYAAVPNTQTCPITIKDGRLWLEGYVKHYPLLPISHAIHNEPRTEPVLTLSEVWFRYDRTSPDIVKGLSVTIHRGEWFALVGGNGTGKTTTLSLMSGLLTPYRGKIQLNGRDLSQIPNEEKFQGLLGVLPQNPQALFLKKTVEADLLEMLSDRKISAEEKQRHLSNICSLCELDALLPMHPYDLSGGEQQRLALAKVLLLEPKILLLDEPTKGLDAHFKQKLAGILQALQNSGVTIVMVSHDIEFCAEYTTRCAMFFDGSIVSTDEPRAFFTGKSFYTTAANRMARAFLPDALLAEDIIHACGGTCPTRSAPPPFHPPIPPNPVPQEAKPLHRLTSMRLLSLVLFVTLFLGTGTFLHTWSDWRMYLVELFMILEASFAIMSLSPGKTLGSADLTLQVPKGQRRLPQRTRVAMSMVLIAIPITIYIGIFYLGDRKYYFISLLILLETMLPFALVFEHRKPQARELVVIAVLCALGVAGRAAFVILPQFKPVVAIVILAAVCLGGETGFLVGAMTGFVSNFFFAQGPWTPWQMFSFGIIGFLAGILFQKGFLRKTRASLCLYGGLSTFLLYGILMDTSAVLMYQAQPTMQALWAAYTLGIPFNLIHAASTVFFLWFAAAPMIEKLERIKQKYGLLE